MDVGSLIDFLPELLEVPFKQEELESIVKSFAKRQDIKVRQIAEVLRYAVTGKTTGVSLYDALVILGKESCIRRINRFLEFVGIGTRQRIMAKPNGVFIGTKV